MRQTRCGATIACKSPAGEAGQVFVSSDCESATVGWRLQEQKEVHAGASGRTDGERARERRRGIPEEDVKSDKCAKICPLQNAKICAAGQTVRGLCT